MVFVCHNDVHYTHTTIEHVVLKTKCRKIEPKSKSFSKLNTKIFAFIIADTSTAVAQLKKGTNSRYCNSVNAVLIKHTGCLPLLFNVIAIYRKEPVITKRARQVSSAVENSKRFWHSQILHYMYILFLSSQTHCHGSIGVLERCIFSYIGFAFIALIHENDTDM